MTRESARAQQRTRPGGRSARVRADVLSATMDAVAEAGYESLSIEDVAARAGVHKTTVYRHWPSRAELVADALLERSGRDVPIPDTGSLLGDLTALGRAVTASLRSEPGGRVARTLVAAASTSAVARGAVAFWAERVRVVGGIVERAAARGEVPADTDPSLVIETFLGPLWLRFILRGEPIDDGVVDEVARVVAAGVTARRTRPGTGPRRNR